MKQRRGIQDDNVGFRLPAVSVEQDAQPRCILVDIPDTFDDGGTGTCSLGTFTLAPGELRFVRVTDFGDNNAIDYFLVIDFR
jgi:hypothetical protein